MRKIAIFIAVSVLLVLCSTPVLANGIPTLPHAFYGSVTVNGAPASNGTQVSAVVDSGSVITNTQNPVTTVGGSYGINSPYLLVQGDIPPGATVTFYVNGVKAEGVSAIFEPGGGPSRHDLSVTIAAPPPPPVVPPSAIYTETNLFGTEGRSRISAEGEILETIEATSQDGMLTITIPKGTKALDKDGKLLPSLTVDVDLNPPDPPEGDNIIGLAYDFDPERATFDPPITFTWSYDPDTLPEDVAEEDLVLAYYDEATGAWLELDCVVDVENNRITASVEHFTTFAIIGAVTPPPPPSVPAVFSVSNLSVEPAEVEPNEAVTISLSVANTGGTEGSYTVVLRLNGVKEAEKRVTIAAGASEIVIFSVTRELAGSYSVTVDGLSASFTVVAPPPPPPPPAEEEEEEIVPPEAVGIAWWVWLIIGGVIVVALLIVFILVRRRAY